MPAHCLHGRAEIAAFLQTDPGRHIYALGDLDDFFWPYTTWYALRQQGRIVQLALVYSGTDLPVLLAVPGQGQESPAELLRAILPLLPRRFYAHLGRELEAQLTPAYRLQSHGVHDKMVLVDRSRLQGVDSAGVVRLAPSDRAQLEALYRASYPDNWFDPRMLETGCYFGLYREARLVSVAGVHVYSPRYRVAALGNIATHPDFRGQGLARVVSARLCQVLLETVDTIGLNVKADNAAAIACYERLGLARVAAYEEFTAVARSGDDRPVTAAID